MCPGMRFYDYLSQHAAPSAGWAQQAPLFSSALLLGVQQADPVEGCEQQELPFAACFNFVSLLF